jgi:hypothetical protein
MKAPTSKIQQDYTSSRPTTRGKSEEENPVYATRRLKVYAFDPQLGRRRQHRISIEIPYEPLEPGPSGRVLRVVDYDAGSRRMYEPVDLDLPAILAGGGLEPRVDDPKFHQQMVYAVAMKTVTNFERALGRTLRIKTLTVLPHAFEGRNAFFHPATDSLCFGYFRADSEHPGENIPGQIVFSCLSSDIVAHEMSHALIHRLRERFLEPTNPDVLAFHEGLADIVAIFQHFALPGVLRDAIRDSQGDLSKPGPLIELARQFGHAAGAGEALRRVHDDEEPDPGLYDATFEPHDRGSVLVRAVFDAFFATYGARVEDLLRLATGGSGVPEEGALHPDLVNRLAEEAADTAQRVLDVCIRAIDYLSPVDVTFGDYLRALVTADSELNPEDPFDLRANLVDSFMARGVYPRDVLSLNEESLLWPAAVPGADGFRPFDPKILSDLFAHEARSWGSKRQIVEYGDSYDQYATAFHEWAKENAHPLGLQPHDADNNPIAVQGFHSMFRVGSDGQLLTEAGVQFIQTPKSESGPEFGGLPIRAGTTVIFSGDGAPRYVISTPIAGDHLDKKSLDSAEKRIKDMKAFVMDCDERDAHHVWIDDDEFSSADRMFRRFEFAAVHQAIRRRRDDSSEPGAPGRESV